MPAKVLITVTENSEGVADFSWEVLEDGNPTESETEWARILSKASHGLVMEGLGRGKGEKITK